MVRITAEGTPIGNPEHKSHRKLAVASAITGGVIAVGALVGIRGRGEETPTHVQNPTVPISRQIDAQPTAGAEAPKIVEKAPDFELKSTTGETVKLSDYKGKPVVIYYLGGTAPGENSLKNAIETATTVRNSNKDIILLTIIWGTGDAKLIKDDITSPILFDSTGYRDEKTGTFYSRLATQLTKNKDFSYPFTIFINRQGEIVDRYTMGTIPSDRLQNGINSITPQPK